MEGKLHFAASLPVGIGSACGSDQRLLTLPHDQWHPPAPKVLQAFGIENGESHE